MNSLLNHYFSTHIVPTPNLGVRAFLPIEDPNFLNARGERRFNIPNFDFHRHQHIERTMTDSIGQIRRRLNALQTTIPLWAIGPEAERTYNGEETRKPDFVVLKYDDEIAGSFEEERFHTLLNLGYFEHTVVECKRATSGDYLNDILYQLKEQCERLENHTHSCFAIAMKGFRIWFFEYFGEESDTHVSFNNSFRRFGFHFLRPHPGIQYWYNNIRGSRLYEGVGMGDPLSGWDLRRDGMVVDHLFRFLSSYNHPLGFNYKEYNGMTFVESPYPF